MAKRTLISVQVTLTNAAQAYQIMALVRAIEPTASGAAREVRIQADPANANPVNFGDSKIGATRYGYQLAAGAARDYRGPNDVVYLEEIYAWGITTAGLKVNVEIMAF